MVASQKSTNVRSYPEARLDQLAELFLRPRARYAAGSEWPAPGWSALSLARGVLPLRGYAVGRGPRVLLVHGWEGASAQMRGLGEWLAARGHQAVAFDLPAHGASPGEQASVPIFAAALRDVATEHGPFDGVIAHSLGGAAAVLAATALAPRWMTLLAPAAEPVHFISAFGRAAGLADSALPELIRAVERRTATHVEELHVPTRAATLQLPLWVFHDPADREVPFAHGAQIAQAAPQGKLLDLAGAGHRRILGDPRVPTALEGLLAPA